MKNFEKGYMRISRKSEKENFKKLKAIGDDTQSQARFVFDKYLESIDVMVDFIKMCPGLEDQKQAILEKTASLKADIQGFVGIPYGQGDHLLTVPGTSDKMAGQ
jgi:hypothetical protein